MDNKTNKKNQKTFDAIKVMREIRNKLSADIATMSYAQERKYLDKLLAQGKAKK